MTFGNLAQRVTRFYLIIYSRATAALVLGRLVGCASRLLVAHPIVRVDIEVMLLQRDSRRERLKFWLAEHGWFALLRLIQG